MGYKQEYAMQNEVSGNHQLYHVDVINTGRLVIYNNSISCRISITYSIFKLMIVLITKTHVQQFVVTSIRKNLRNPSNIQDQVR